MQVWRELPRMLDQRECHVASLTCLGLLSVSLQVPPQLCMRLILVSCLSDQGITRLTSDSF